MKKIALLFVVLMAVTAVHAEKVTMTLAGTFNTLKVDNVLTVNYEVGNSVPTLILNGKKELIDRFQYTLNRGTLSLSIKEQKDKKSINSEDWDGFSITLKAPMASKFELESMANVKVNNVDCTFQKFSVDIRSMAKLYINGTINAANADIDVDSMGDFDIKKLSCTGNVKVDVDSMAKVSFDSISGKSLDASVASMAKGTFKNINFSNSNIEVESMGKVTVAGKTHTLVTDCDHMGSLDMSSLKVGSGK